MKQAKLLAAIAFVLGVSVSGLVGYADGVARFLTSFMLAVNQGKISPVLVGIALIGMSRVIRKIMVQQGLDQEDDS
jgi:hypothetical protein